MWPWKMWPWNRKTPEELIENAIKKWVSGDAKGAIAEFAHVIGLSEATNKDKAVARYNCGNVRKSEKDLRGAIKDFSATIAAKIDDPELRALALLGRGECQARLDQLQEAEKDFTDCIQMKGVKSVFDVWRCDAYFRRGMVRIDTGALDGAIKDFKYVIANANAKAITKQHAQTALQSITKSN